MSEPAVYLIRPAIVVPIALSIGAVFLGICTNAWALVALPFIVLGSICAAPNFNLANGLFAIVATIFGLIMGTFHPAIGCAIFVGTLSSWILSSIEKIQTAVPVSTRAASEKHLADDV